MTALYLSAALIAGLLAGYLLVALCRPEWF